MLVCHKHHATYVQCDQHNQTAMSCLPAIGATFVVQPLFILLNCSFHQEPVCILQFMVDISTPASVLDSTSQALQAHMDENSTEYKSGSLSVSFSTSDDPLKVQLAVSFEYSHNGKQASVHAVVSTIHICSLASFDCTALHNVMV